MLSLGNRERLVPFIHNSEEKNAGDDLGDEEASHRFPAELRIGAGMRGKECVCNGSGILRGRV
jgi:hypothetical protein